MKIYIDGDCKCHIYAAEGRREFELPFFDGKCRQFIEGYRYVPSGETWTREDGEVFTGEMISPCKDYTILKTAQEAYDEAFGDREDMENALNTLGVNA